MKKTFVEFFAGIGLMRVGLEAEGWESAWANDLDQRAAERGANTGGECFE